MKSSVTNQTTDLLLMTKINMATNIFYDQSIVHEDKDDQSIVHEDKDDQSIVHEDKDNQSIVHEDKDDQSIVHENKDDQSIVHENKDDQSIVHEDKDDQSIVHEDKDDQSIVHGDPTYTVKNLQAEASLPQAYCLAVIKLISGCVRIACSTLMVTSLQQVINNRLDANSLSRLFIHKLVASCFK